MQLFASLTRRLIFVSTLFVSSLAHANFYAVPSINMPQGVTPISHDIYDLHMTIFWICVVIGVLVFGAMFYALIMHRKARGFKAAHFHHNMGMEIVWTIIPFFILVAMAVPATNVLIRMNDTAAADVNIKITGYQWRWKYEYLDEGISFYSNLSTPQQEMMRGNPKNQWYLLQVDNPLVVPTRAKIRFLVTSNDVVHSWWVPELGIKRDALPGFIYEAWAWIEKPGVYRGQCAELCGINHGFMPIVVIAKTPKEYAIWVAKQTGQKAQLSSLVTTAPVDRDELMKIGKDNYLANCSACHKPDGKGNPPAYPSLRGSPVATGPVAEHIQVVLHGRSHTAMQAFDDILTDKQIASIITYERNAWGNSNKKKYGNNAGGIVQPADIGKARIKD
ncbi:MAG TPA: cytochrome c oxidase subunit II [Coxiellaceae bacterium]|nr:cytochrome c oxidase subunit II [Coxiellaceae bacterium]